MLLRGDLLRRLKFHVVVDDICLGKPEVSSPERVATTRKPVPLA